MANPTDDKTDDKTDDSRHGNEIGRLVDAIREVARAEREPDTDQTPEQRLLIQRVDFGYRALGTLMGRLSTGSSARFDVPVFGASWAPRGSVIALTGLPREVEWIELGDNRRTETVRVRRGGDHDRPEAHPEKFTPDKRIDSVLGLGHRRGPVVALGPRVAPRPRRND